MAALNLEEVIALRKLLEVAGAGRLHLHDACGAQYFSLEGGRVAAEVVAIIEEFLDGLGMRASFNITGDGFSITRK